MAYFPVFIDIEGLSCLVAGGGRVALGKITRLLEYGAAVTVVAPEILPEILQMDGTVCLQRKLEDDDLLGKRMVIAATDDHEENHRLAELCREAGIPVNAVDQPQDCSFYFSSMVRQGDLVAAFSSSGKSPVMTQYLKARTQSILTERLGRINDLLGEMRPIVKGACPEPALRKEIFRSLADYLLQQEELPDCRQLTEYLETVLLPDM